MDPTQEEKEKFFSDLDRLDDLSDDLETATNVPTCSITLKSPPKLKPFPSSTELLGKLSRPNHYKISPSTATKDARSRTSYTDPNATKRTLNPKSAQSHKPRSKPNRRPSSKDTLQLLPEEQQVFKGQVFFFVPNDDVAALRKLRIRKARERGALWVRELSENVTYVIVDNDLTLSDVSKYRYCRNNEALHQAKIVNDKWLTESLGCQEMRDPTASRFKLAGNLSAPIATITSAQITLAPERRQTHQVLWLQQAAHESSEHEEGISTGHLQKESDGKVYCQTRSSEQSSRANDILEQRSRPKSALHEIVGDIGKLDRFQPVVTNFTIENAGLRCMEKNDGSRNQGNPNTPSVEILQQMASFYDSVGDLWRTRAHRQAISALDKQVKRIEMKEEAHSVPFRGEPFAAKIEETTQTDRLRRLERTNTDPNSQLLRLFMGIYQVGYPMASRWISQGYQSLEDLKKNVDLTPNQRIGI